MTTLVLDAELPWQVDIGTGLTTIGEQENGPVPVEAKHQREVRIWNLTLNNAMVAVKQAIDTAHDDTNGGAAVMDWTPPHGAATIKVRFMPGKRGYRKQKISAVLWNITLSLEEAHSAT